MDNSTFQYFAGTWCLNCMSPVHFSLSFWNYHCLCGNNGYQPERWCREWPGITIQRCIDSNHYVVTWRLYLTIVPWLTSLACTIDWIVVNFHFEMLYPLYMCMCCRFNDGQPTTADRWHLAVCQRLQEHCHKDRLLDCHRSSNNRCHPHWWRPTVPLSKDTIAAVHPPCLRDVCPGDSAGYWGVGIWEWRRRLPYVLQTI